jgi:AcrR family transcriptional regulator
MTPERRREMIVAAAVPLIAEHGAALTTSRIARAAGIGEATIFRVFADKDELLDACIVEVLKPDTALDSIAAIPLDEPLAERLVEAAGSLAAHLRRVGEVIGALWARSNRPRPAPDQDAVRRRSDSMEAVVDAVSALFEPDADRLRLPPRKLAELFVGQLFTRGRSPIGPDLSTEQVVDLFLHGALGEGTAA